MRKTIYICDLCSDFDNEVIIEGAMFIIKVTTNHQGTEVTHEKHTCQKCKEKLFPIRAI